jgi:hypothetical protein
MFSICIGVVLSGILLADTIVLKNGLKLEGTYKGGTETIIKFETSGAIQEIALSEVVSIAFSGNTAQQAVSQASSNIPATAGTAPVAALTDPITVPAGTDLMVRIDKSINTAEHKEGSVITGELETDLVVDGTFVVPKGTKLYGVVLESIGGRRLGKQRIVFQYNSIMINKEKIAIATDPLGAEGGRGGALKTIAGAALIGGAIDGNQGAKTGALLGAGASVLAGGKHIQIPAGTLAEIPLNAPLEIQ